VEFGLAMLSACKLTFRKFCNLFVRVGCIRLRNNVCDPSKLEQLSNQIYPEFQTKPYFAPRIQMSQRHGFIANSITYIW